MAGGGWVGWGDWVPRREPPVRVVTDRTWRHARATAPRSQGRRRPPEPAPGPLV